MESSQIYVLISIIALAVIFVVLFFVRRDKKGKRLSKLAAFSLMFVVTGILFGDDRRIGYSLMGIGVLLAIIDIIMKRKK